jgi:hypothetical protein
MSAKTGTFVTRRYETNPEPDLNTRGEYPQAMTRGRPAATFFFSYDGWTDVPAFQPFQMNRTFARRVETE